MQHFRKSRVHEIHCNFDSAAFGLKKIFMQSFLAQNYPWYFEKHLCSPGTLYTLPMFTIFFEISWTERLISRTRLALSQFRNRYSKLLNGSLNFTTGVFLGFLEVVDTTFFIRIFLFAFYFFHSRHFSESSGKNSMFTNPFSAGNFIFPQFTVWPIITNYLDDKHINDADFKI